MRRFLWADDKQPDSDAREVLGRNAHHVGDLQRRQCARGDTQIVVERARRTGTSCQRGKSESQRLHCALPLLAGGGVTRGGETIGGLLGGGVTGAGGASTGRVCVGALARIGGAGGFFEASSLAVVIS